MHLTQKIFDEINAFTTITTDGAPAVNRPGRCFNVAAAPPNRFYGEARARPCL